MSKKITDFSIRETLPSDQSYLLEWLNDPAVLQGFPMDDIAEIEDSIKIWFGYSAHLHSGLTIEVGGAVVGLALLYLQFLGATQHNCLFTIVVAKPMRGQGVGRALLEALMKLAKEKFSIEILHLEVYDANPAKFLYERLGFEIFGRHDRFLLEANGQYRARLCMQKRL